MSELYGDDTIVAVSTPIGEGGIGIVRLSGPKSLVIAGKIFVSADGKALADYPTYTVHYGKAHDPRTREIIDEVIVTVMRAPKSYTKEDVVEINCHGGSQSVKCLLDSVLRAGARLAGPGEFTKRAFLNGRIDLAQAEAVIDVIRSKTEASLKVALNQLGGELSRKIDAIREFVIDIAAEIEAAIDFSEEDTDLLDKTGLLNKIDSVVLDLERLLVTYGGGSILREGVLAIICGKPNVGKSSLMNLLLKRDRVIVSPIPGTTRDAVEEMINVQGIPIRVVDTAGIADTEDRLEREGIARSKKYLGMADIALVVLDNSVSFDRADEAIIAMVSDKKKIVVINKADLPQKIEMEKLKALFGGGSIVTVSVEKRTGIELLEKEIARTIWSGSFVQGDSAVVSNARHKELLDKAHASMLSVKKAVIGDESPEIITLDLKEAISFLGLVIGKTVSDDILDRIFERFCIGK